MKLIDAALAALNNAEARYHELVDPVAQLFEHVKALAKATAGHVRTLEARLAAAESALKTLEDMLVHVSNAPAIQSDVGLEPAPPPSVVITAAEIAPPSDQSAASSGAPAVSAQAPAGSEALAVVPIQLSPQVAAG
jgi:hypothetical protein